MAIFVPICLISVGFPDAIIILVGNGVAIPIEDAAALGHIGLEGAWITGISKTIPITVWLLALVHRANGVEQRGTVVLAIRDAVAILIPLGELTRIGVRVAIPICLPPEGFTGGFVLRNPTMNKPVIQARGEFVVSPVRFLSGTNPIGLAAELEGVAALGKAADDLGPPREGAPSSQHQKDLFGLS